MTVSYSGTAQFLEEPFLRILISNFQTSQFSGSITSFTNYDEASFIFLYFQKTKKRKQQWQLHQRNIYIWARDLQSKNMKLNPLLMPRENPFGYLFI
jgi:hypothetical protein